MAELDGPSGADRSAGSRIAVIDKAVRALDALLAAPDGLTPTDVATALGTNRSTAFRLLTSLEQAGLLARDGSGGRYRLGIKLLQYGEAVRAGIALIDLADAAMRRLRDDTRQSVLLAVREGWGARCVHRLPGPEVDVLSWGTGELLPLHIGAAPLALLSALPPAQLDRYLAHGPWQTRLGTRHADDVRADARAASERGWALNREGLTAGVTSLGTVVRDAIGAPVCALSVAGLDRHYEGEAVQRTAERVLAAAAEVGRRLGAS